MDINFLKEQLKNEIDYLKKNNVKNDYKNQEYLLIMEDIYKIRNLIRNLIRSENGFSNKKYNH